MDLFTIIGTVIGIGGMVLGFALEGGHLVALISPTSLIIVGGGTLGATLVAFPPQDLKNALNFLPLILKNVNLDVRPAIEEIVRIATIARKEGVLAVEGQRDSIQNELFKKSIKFVIDGFEPNTVKEIIDTEIFLEFEERENAAKVYDGAGGFAPTIGIIGAVLGLIHVMSQLDEPSKIGAGIAAAFTATIYGLVIANIMCIPWGTKIKRKAAQEAMTKEVIKLGVVGIQEGLNPHFLQEKLEVYVEEHLRKVEEEK